MKEIIVRCFDHNWLSSADRLGQIKIPISEVEVEVNNNTYHRDYFQYFVQERVIVLICDCN